MRVLLDENLPHWLRHHLFGHHVVTVAYTGGAGIQNGELLRRAEEAGFDVLVTGDQNLAYQQNLTGRSIAIVTVSAQDRRSLQRHLAAISAAIHQAACGSYQVIDCGSLPREAEEKA